MYRITNDSMKWQYERGAVTKQQFPYDPHIGPNTRLPFLNEAWTYDIQMASAQHILNPNYYHYTRISFKIKVHWSELTF
jgi:hypothetical protein